LTWEKTNDLLLDILSLTVSCFFAVVFFRRCNVFDKQGHGLVFTFKGITQHEVYPPGFCDNAVCRFDVLKSVTGNSS
jgi:hypothetical protein